MEILFDEEQREELAQQIVTKFYGNLDLGEGKAYIDTLLRFSEEVYDALLTRHFPNYLKQVIYVFI